jgi:hypothetical protein
MPGRLLKICVLLALIPVAVMAHHGFGGRYDRSAPVLVQGVVVNAYFGQPHPEITLDTDPATDLPALLPERLSAGLVPWTEATATVEFPPIGTFFGLDSTVAAGDRVTIVALRNCDPPHQLRGQWISIKGQGEAEATGRVQTEVDGC